jgi:V8-like Glu-specific endopeptidase
MDSNDPRDFFDELKQLVKMNEFNSAIDQLVAFLSGCDRKLYNESILLSSRFLSITTKERKGLISESDATVQKARIGSAILDFVDEVERQLNRSQLPFPFKPVDFSPPVEANLEKIIGNNNLKSVAWLHQALEAAKAVCRVVTRNGLGTGFLIGANRLMTNHHVIPDKSVAEESAVEFNFQEDLSNKLQPVSRYSVLADTMKANAKLDYCIVEVNETAEQPPLESWGQLEMAHKSEPGKGEHVSIIQHPRGGLKQIAITANQVVNTFEHRLQYTTDTLPGSSGSPVFNDKWNVVALHHAGGNMLTNARGDRMFANEGILIGHILDDSEI